MEKYLKDCPFCGGTAMAAHNVNAGRTKQAKMVNSMPPVLYFYDKKV